MYHHGNHHGQIVPALRENVQWATYKVRAKRSPASPKMLTPFYKMLPHPNHTKLKLLSPSRLSPNSKMMLRKVHMKKVLLRAKDLLQNLRQPCRRSVFICSIFSFSFFTPKINRKLQIKKCIQNLNNVFNLQIEK